MDPKKQNRTRKKTVHLMHVFPKKSLPTFCRYFAIVFPVRRRVSRSVTSSGAELYSMYILCIVYVHLLRFTPNQSEPVRTYPSLPEPTETYQSLPAALGIIPRLISCFSARRKAPLSASAALEDSPPPPEGTPQGRQRIKHAARRNASSGFFAAPV